MKNTNLLILALDVAQDAHTWQKDKAGRPYIEHVLRVYGQAKNDDERIVALLHDVVEDSDYTLKSLEIAGFPPHIISAVDAITKRSGEPYDDYINRVKENRVALSVKIYDLNDNLDIKRMKSVKEKDLTRLNKYLASYSFLNRG